MAAPRHASAALRTPIRVLLGILVLGVADAAASLEAVVLGDGEQKQGVAFEYLEDPTRSLTLDQVSSPELADRWTVSEKQTLNLGLTASAAWIRFQVAPASDLSTAWLLEIDYSMNDVVEFYQPEPGGGHRVERAGDALRHSEWSIPGRTPRFALDLVPGLEQTYYLRVVSEDTLLVPFTLASEPWLAASDASRRFWLGLFLGAFAALAIYHLLLFANLRDVTYLYYVLTITCFVGYQTAYSGLVGQYLVPESIVLKQRFGHFIGSILLVVLYDFTKSFTLIEKTDPGWNTYRKWLNRALYALVPSAAFLPLRLFNAMVIFIAIAGATQVIVDSWKAWRSGYTPAGYFLLSWVWACVAGIIFGLRGLGAVPDNFLTANSLQIGSVMTVISVAFSMSDRISLLQRELKAGVEEKQELLAEVQSLNVNLEARIKERTTELEEQAVLLAAQSRDLEAASRHKSEFLASMSHELRTPLNAVIGFSEVLVDRTFGELNEKQEQYLNHIHSSGRHLLSLINDILDLAKIEAGRLELEFAEFHLPTAISNSMVLMKERALRGGIELQSEIGKEIAEIVGDERKVKQVLINLLSNAVKFTPRGGKVTLSARRVDERVQLAVADTGIGISPEDQELVFEEFRQVGTDVRRQAEGTGLGLALAKRLVEAHGGRIWLESRLGEGTTFWVELPVVGQPPDVDTPMESA